MRMVLFRQCVVLTAMREVIKGGVGVQHRILLAVPCDCGAGQGAERRVLILGAAHYLLNQHITGAFEARTAELFTSVFSAGQKLALTGHGHTH